MPLYKPQFDHGGGGIVNSSGNTIVVKDPDGNVIYEGRASRGSEGSKWQLPINKIPPGSTFSIDGGPSYNIKDPSQRNEYKQDDGGDPTHVGGNGSVGSGGGNNPGGSGDFGPYTPGQVGQYGIIPANILNQFPTVAEIPGAAKDYKYIDPIKFGEQYADFQRKQLATNFAQSRGMALDALDTEFQGLQKYVPQSSALKRDQTALDNTFNQAERTKQVNAAIPDVVKDYNQQASDARAYARGEVPNPVIDHALEISNRSAAADVASTSGFGANSSAARKTSDLMSAKDRIQLSQYGEGLLSNNAQARTQLFLAPTEYSNAGQQVNVMPSLSGSQLQTSIFGQVNQSSLVSAENALSNVTQQSQFVSNLVQRTQEYNNTNVNNFALSLFNAKTSYANSVANGAQTNLNTGIQVDQQAEYRRIVEEQIKAAQDRGDTEAIAKIIAAFAPSLIGLGTDILNRAFPKPTNEPGGTTTTPPPTGGGSTTTPPASTPPPANDGSTPPPASTPPPEQTPPPRDNAPGDGSENPPIDDGSGGTSPPADSRTNPDGTPYDPNAVAPPPRDDGNTEVGTNPDGSTSSGDNGFNNDGSGPADNSSHEDFNRDIPELADNGGQSSEASQRLSPAGQQRARAAISAADARSGVTTAPATTGQVNKGATTSTITGPNGQPITVTQPIGSVANDKAHMSEKAAAVLAAAGIHSAQKEGTVPVGVNSRGKTVYADTVAQQKMQDAHTQATINTNPGNQGPTTTRRTTKDGATIITTVNHNADGSTTTTTTGGSKPTSVTSVATKNPDGSNRTQRQIEEGNRAANSPTSADPQSMPDVIAKVLEPTGVIDTAAKNTLTRIGEISRDAGTLMTLADLYLKKDAKGFVNLMLTKLGQPGIKDLVTDPNASDRENGDRRAGVSAAFTAYNIFQNWGHMNNVARGKAIAGLGLQTYRFSTGENLGAKFVVGGADASARYNSKGVQDPDGMYTKGGQKLNGMTVTQALDLFSTGYNVYSMVKNWDQYSTIEKIAAGTGSVASIARVAQQFNLLGYGGDGSAVANASATELARAGFTSAPNYGVGAIQAPAGTTAPAGYSAVGSTANGQIVMAPIKNMSTTASVVNGLQGVAGIASIALGAYQVYQGWGTGGKSGAMNGAIGGAAIVAGISTTSAASVAAGYSGSFALGPYAAAAVIAVAMIADANHTGKGGDQVKRDQVMRYMKDTKMINSDGTMVLADGSSVDVGLDGGGGTHTIRDTSKLSPAAQEQLRKQGGKLSAYNIDYTNDLDYTAGLQGVALSRLIVGSSEGHVDQVGARLGNGFLGQKYGQDMTEASFAKVQANARAMYFKAGIQSKNDAYQMSNQAFAEGRITETELVGMQRAYDTVFDQNGMRAAQPLLTGRFRGTDVMSDLRTT